MNRVGLEFGPRPGATGSAGPCWRRLTHGHRAGSPRLGCEPWRGHRRWPDRQNNAAAVATAPVDSEEGTGHSLRWWGDVRPMGKGGHQSAAVHVAP
jgi:hypothetical protein